MEKTWAKIYLGDCKQRLLEIESNSIQCVVTSPPYWNLRNYDNDAQIGMEKSADEFVEQLCQVFDEIHRVLKEDGTLWLNLGDTYFNKNLVGIPWKVAFALQKRGWYLRQDIIWAKSNPMPENVTDRCTKSHEYIFLLSKSERYYFDNEVIKEQATENDGGFFGGKKYGNNDDPLFATKTGKLYTSNGKRNKRDVWTVATARFKDAHFATYPAKLITPCVLAGSKEGDIILDPFSGSGTTGEVALLNQRNYIGCELNSEYIDISLNRLSKSIGILSDVEVV
jgi:DNA modification methylase